MKRPWTLGDERDEDNVGHVQCSVCHVWVDTMVDER